MTRQRKFGPMDVDYRVRAVAVVPEINIPGHYYMPEHQKIFYGCDAERINGIQSVVFDVIDKFKDLGRGGRKSGNPIELEKSKHYYNQRIFLHGETIQGHSDKNRVGARDGEGGEDGALEVEAGEGSAGCSDPSCRDPNCKYDSEEAQDNSEG